jgi:hypothetical protein
MELIIGFIMILVFIVLKLANVIEWSWIWVLSPIWLAISNITEIVPWYVGMLYFICFGLLWTIGLLVAIRLHSRWVDRNCPSARNYKNKHRTGREAYKAMLKKSRERKKNE